MESGSAVNAPGVCNDITAVINTDGRYTGTLC
nr:hypothetical protein JGFBKGGF_00013 [Gallid alphaherpesvirus 2]WOL21890.1 hypothetical protein JGFBKGGF_00087 [Gallid alphaherpesvirus 2]